MATDWELISDGEDYVITDGAVPVTKKEEESEQQQCQDKDHDSTESTSNDDDDFEDLDTDGEDDNEDDHSNTVIMITDIEALHCIICTGLLSSPVYQCSKGHTLCNQCRERYGNNCMVACGEAIGLIRCLAIEKVIESAKVQCAYARYGCRATIAYHRKQAHESFCIYAPCSCPVLDCKFKGSSQQLSTHFTLKHQSVATNFAYELFFRVSLEKNEPFVILREEEEGLLFLLHKRKLNEGNSVVVRYMAAYSQRSKTGFSYEVVHRTRRGGCSRFESRVERVKSREEAAYRYYSYADFLVIPSSPCSADHKPLHLELCIKRN